MHTEHRRPETEYGRRSGDFWGRIGKAITIAVSAIAILTLFGKIWTVAAQVPENKATILVNSSRITKIEQLQLDGHYMTCVLFQEVHPQSVPVSCDLALRRNSR